MSVLTYGQTTTFNKLDAKGKKTGYWKVYLNANAMLTDSANSYFYGYEFYDNDKAVPGIFEQVKEYSNIKLIFSGKTSTKGNPIAINGMLKEYFIKEGKDELNAETCYRDGFPQTFKEYLAGNIITLADFTKRYNYIEGTYFISDYLTYIVTSETRRKTTCYWYRKEKNKWIGLKRLVSK